jgi:hypothetical protein
MPDHDDLLRQLTAEREEMTARRRALLKRLKSERPLPSGHTPAGRRIPTDSSDAANRRPSVDGQRP